MTSPAGSFLDFFVLEAGEYVEQIDALILRAAATGPDADQLQKVARALRGSATMAKLPSFAELASSMESVGRSLRQGALAWDAGLKGALTGAVDDLKILVRAARAWTPNEDQWAAKRVAELSRYVAPATGAPTPMASSSGAYFGAEAMNIAAGLDLLATRPDDQSSALNVLQRVRALRGVAGVRDIPALHEVAEAAESAVRPLELGELRLTPDHINVLRTAADLLRAIAAAVAAGTTITTSTPQYMAFLTSMDGMTAHAAGGDRVVPITDLFYSDAGPHVVSAAPNPPTTPAQRFRMEVVSLGEHLHRVIDEARAAGDEIQREHAKGELGRALRAIRATAASFGQTAVARTVEQYIGQTGNLNISALDAIASFATTISPAAQAPTPIFNEAMQMPRVSQLRAAVSGRPAPVPAAPALPTPAPARPVAHAMAASPVAARGPSSLDSTIAAFDSLASERLAEPKGLNDDVVPVDVLLYRGRAALDRAVELRDAIRRAGGAPAPEVLEELYDLVELARV